MYSKQNVLVGAVVIIGLCLVIGTYITDNEKISVPIENKDQMISDVKEGFMEGCTEDGSILYEDCLCTFYSLKNQLGEQGAVDLALDYYKTEQIPKKVMNKVIEDCN